jgi:hypothetical protein
MADSGRLQPFVAITQSIASAMPAKGSLRPEMVIGRCLAECQLPDQTFEPIAAAQSNLFDG